MHLNIAVSQFHIQPSEDAEKFFLRLKDLIQKAHEHGAHLFVLPEYFSLSHIFGNAPTVECELAPYVKKSDHFSQTLQDYLKNLAQELHLTIISGTMPVFTLSGKLTNRCFTYFPDGSSTYQDKLHMTRWEKEHWNYSE